MRPPAPLCECGMLPVKQKYKNKRWVSYPMCEACMENTFIAAQAPPAPTLESLQEEINELRTRLDMLDSRSRPPWPIKR